jgi:uncharacterized membrane protein
MAFCANCGSPVEGRFCAKCGAAQTTAAAPAGTPLPATAAPMAQSAPLAENVASALCYALTVITGVLFLVLEPYNKNRNIRFHAFQAIFLFIAALVCRIALSFLFTALWSVSGFFLVSALSMLFGLACLILWLYMLVSTYQGKRVVLPVIGPLAEKQA